MQNGLKINSNRALKINTKKSYKAIQMGLKNQLKNGFNKSTQKGLENQLKGALKSTQKGLKYQLKSVL